MRVIDLVGKKFGLLTVRAMLPGKECLSDCDCGTVGFVTERYSVRAGLTRSCGCFQGRGNFIHGESRIGHWTPEYRAWVNMRTRCFNPKSTRYKNWGGRGITVCDQWREDYPAFLAYVGRRPGPTYSLDRSPNADGNYEPGNVRWASRKEQSRNQRSNRQITASGKTLSLTEWAETLGIKPATLLWRLDHGWSVEESLSPEVATLSECGRLANAARWADRRESQYAV